ncbi:LysR family transcriptional regulator [Streptosporangium sp. NPDC023963]|uniref:LysR family transcriptional regulator n=1 Tax=Streptosporangium sp. NPDC023963 TaxID=3155608 RepID=UPI00341CFD4A
MAEELHFGRAAMRPYISQPSLSHRIRKLEEILGTPLFVRSSRRAGLTAAGRALIIPAHMRITAIRAHPPRGTAPRRARDDAAQVGR